MAPQTAKAEDTRARILAAAVRLFNGSGTAAVTTPETPPTTNITMKLAK